MNGHGHEIPVRIHEAAHILGVSASCLRDHIRGKNGAPARIQPEIPCTRWGGVLRFYPSQLEEFKRKHSYHGVLTEAK